MYVIDLDSTAKDAFVHGFVKGLAAPVCLYHSEPLPKLANVMTVVYHPHSPKQDMARSWAAVGEDLRKVISVRQARQASAG
ncbi:MAG: hypothetical protein E6Q94_01620 [Burkholderiaceae bacterium]|jgi:hypothetical protein|nr:MAG: hypothetical protein E6Q94_01620 [Burkholderiaceae bacterium]